MNKENNFNIPNCEECGHISVCRYRNIDIREVISDLRGTIDNNGYMSDDFIVTLTCKQYTSNLSPKLFN